MKVISYFITTIFSSACAMNAYAVNIIPDYSMKTYNQAIERIYDNSQLKTEHNMEKRINIISALFLGKPYLNDALGEGKKASFDEHPLYRTDAFDCMTYVSTVLALAESNNFTMFKKNMLRVQYYHGVPIFVNRLHFTDVDWNKVNTQNGFIEDITTSFKSEQGKSIAQIANAFINKPSWYKKMTTDRLYLLKPLSSQEEKKRLAELHSLAYQVKGENGSVPYLPLNILFNTDGKPNLFIFNQIPSGSIIEIVRPNWNLEKEIGTNLSISHLGFAIRTPEGLMFREASSLEHRVIDIPLTSYLKNYMDSATVKGINIHKVT